MANICLAAHGHAARIDHRSYAERGIALEPQNKIGLNAIRRAARGEPSERMDEHRAIDRFSTPSGLPDAPLRSGLDDRRKPWPAPACSRVLALA